MGSGPEGFPVRIRGAGSGPSADRPARATCSSTSRFVSTGSLSSTVDMVKLAVQWRGSAPRATSFYTHSSFAASTAARTLSLHTFFSTHAMCSAWQPGTMLVRFARTSPPAATAPASFSALAMPQCAGVPATCHLKPSHTLAFCLFQRAEAALWSEMGYMNRIPRNLMDLTIGSWYGHCRKADQQSQRTFVARRYWAVLVPLNQLAIDCSSIQSIQNLPVLAYICI